jgi:hypothetical protein
MYLWAGYRALGLAGLAFGVQLGEPFGAAGAHGGGGVGGVGPEVLSAHARSGSIVPFPSRAPARPRD